MAIEIKDRHTGAVRLSVKAETLVGANLSGADLKNGEKLEGRRPVTMLGPIGSRGDFLVCYRTDKGLLFDVGCQRQIDEKTFRARLARDHSGTAYEREYLAALDFFKAQGEAWES